MYFPQTPTFNVVPLLIFLAVFSTILSTVTSRADTLTKEITETNLLNATHNIDTPAKTNDSRVVTTEKIFGSKKKTLHPYIALKGEWTDNVYNINNDMISNMLTTFSPGIWIELAGNNNTPEMFTSYNTAIGGIRFSNNQNNTFDRFRSYLLGELEYKNYSHDYSLNYTAWRVEGLFQYSTPVGISFRLFDRVILDRDRYDYGSFLPEDFSIADDETVTTSTPSRIRDYFSNQFKLSVKSNVSEKFALILSHVNFHVDYNDVVNAWLDRNDMRSSLSLTYTHSPKTSLLIKYDYADISYDANMANNNTNNFYQAGITWKATPKTSIQATGGYQSREYKSIKRKINDTFTLDLRLNYLVTDKTKISLMIYKAMEESNSLGILGRDTFETKIRYDQHITHRIRGIIECWYEINDYGKFIRADFNDVENARNDKRILFRPSLQYIFNKWFIAELSYSYENRDSTDEIYNFSTHTITLSINASF